MTTILSPKIIQKCCILCQPGTPVSFLCLFARIVKEKVLGSNLMSLGCQQNSPMGGGESHTRVVLGILGHSSFSVVKN